MTDESGNAQQQQAVADVEFRQLCSDLTLQTKKDGFFKVGSMGPGFYLSFQKGQFSLAIPSKGLLSHSDGESQSGRIRSLFPSGDGS